MEEDNPRGLILPGAVPKGGKKLIEELPEDLSKSHKRKLEANAEELPFILSDAGQPLLEKLTNPPVMEEVVQGENPESVVQNTSQNEKAESDAPEKNLCKEEHEEHLDNSSPETALKRKIARNIAEAEKLLSELMEVPKDGKNEVSEIVDELIQHLPIPENLSSVSMLHEESVEMAKENETQFIGNLEEDSSQCANFGEYKGNLELFNTVTYAVPENIAPKRHSGILPELEETSDLSPEISICLNSSQYLEEYSLEISDHPSNDKSIISLESFIVPGPENYEEGLQEASISQVESPDPDDFVPERQICIPDENVNDDSSDPFSDYMDLLLDQDHDLGDVLEFLKTSVSARQANRLRNKFQKTVGSKKVDDESSSDEESSDSSTLSESHSSDSSGYVNYSYSWNESSNLPRKQFLVNMIDESSMVNSSFDKTVGVSTENCSGNNSEVIQECPLMSPSDFIEGAVKIAHQSSMVSTSLISPEVPEACNSESIDYCSPQSNAFYSPENLEWTREISPNSQKAASANFHLHDTRTESSSLTDSESCAESSAESSSAEYDSFSDYFPMPTDMPRITSEIEKYDRDFASLDDEKFPFETLSLLKNVLELTEEPTTIASENDQGINTGESTKNFGLYGVCDEDLEGNPEDFKDRSLPPLSTTSFAKVTNETFTEPQLSTIMPLPSPSTEDTLDDESGLTRAPGLEIDARDSLVDIELAMKEIVSEALVRAEAIFQRGVNNCKEIESSASRESDGCVEESGVPDFSDGFSLSNIKETPHEGRVEAPSEMVQTLELQVATGE